MVSGPEGPVESRKVFAVHEVDYAPHVSKKEAIQCHKCQQWGFVNHTASDIHLSIDENKERAARYGITVQPFVLVVGA
ncbi:hypothetical protein QE152_g22667 [Popillia japonica]|uniref:Uncharacterized protein n=1 Tax=Popillia japonica TaxID=7064 RepID=A0AAW1KI06_POPJA